MVILSRFTHVYDLGTHIALYHSLRMKPVYLSRDVFDLLNQWLQREVNGDVLHSCPVSIEADVKELFKYKILLRSESEDKEALQFVRSKIPPPAINVCYIITSEQCNLACKYCFLGNNDNQKRNKFLSDDMSLAVADKSLDFFIRQIKESGLDVENNRPVLIFYGGEPLVNYPVVEYIAEKVNRLKNNESSIRHLEMSVITNGTLLDENKIKRLSQLGVAIAISLDGFTEEANNMRVDLGGSPVFSRVLKSLDLCKELGVEVSLSVTLSEETIKNPAGVLNLLDQYGIKSLGFNIMMSSDTFVLSDEYNVSAAEFLIKEFVELRKRGIYEDRMMRKLKSFSKSRIYFSDCAATSGSQIVIAPDGRVGVCHGCLYDKRYFVSNVFDDKFVAAKDPVFIEWSELTPLNREECLMCPALGICGGGCPVNAMNLEPGNTIHSMDKRFCVHAKKTLEFFIKDLYRIILRDRQE